MEALVTDVVAADIATRVSCPVQVQVSPFVHSAMLFSELLDAETLRDQQTHQSSAEYILSQYRVGKRVTLIYNNGRFVAKNSSQGA